MKLLSIFGGALALAAGVPAAAVITNVSATDVSGNTLTLAAGTYTVSFAGVAGGGTYDGYSPFPSTAGCDSSGAHCSAGWLDAVGIDFGHGTGTFDRVGSYVYIDKSTAVDQFATALQALANVRTAPLYKVLASTIGDLNTYMPTPYPISFTLASEQAVNFYVYDTGVYSDNRGGISVSVATPTASGTPEPESWALMLVGFGAIGGIMRRRTGPVRVAA